MNTRTVLMIPVLVLLAAITSQAQIPRTISYQGILCDVTGKPKPDNTYQMTFRLYETETGGTAIWTGQKTVTLTRGLFAVQLGPFDASLKFNKPTWLAVQLQGEGSELSPRTALSSVGYSFSAVNADTAAYAVDIKDGAVTTFKLADATITAGKAASGQFVKSINTLKDDVTLQAGTNVAIGASGNALTISASGNSGTITGVTPEAPLAGGGVSGNVPISLNDLGVTTAKLADGAATAAKLADNAVTSEKIANGAIINADISAIATIDPGKISGTAWTSANDGAGSGLDADMVDSKHASEFVTGVHDHFGQVWSGWTSGNGLWIRGNVGWSSGMLLVDNTSTGPSIWGYNSGGGNAVRGDAFGVGSIGVYGGSESNAGVVGRSTSFRGVEGYGRTGVYGESDGSGTGVTGYCTGATGNGVLGEANDGTDARGIWGRSTNGYAGYFDGKVRVSGYLTKAGGGFLIDHPLDPANKFLYHSFVESPDMMNIYNGNITLDARGEAVVALPEWFGALNKEFRYQLTCIGGFAPAYIAEEISGNHFRIAGGLSGMKVSWQVTGIRHDAYAAAHPVAVEVAKAGTELGKYLHPKEFGLTAEMGIGAEKVRQRESVNSRTSKEDIRTRPR